MYIRDGRAPIPKKESISRVMSANKGRNTGPELLLRKAMWKSGIRGYRLDWKKVPGRPDIAFPGQKKAIFVHGCYWHRCPKCKSSLPKSNTAFWKEKFKKNKERDKRNEKELITLEWNVLVIWECDIKNDIDDVIHEVITFINMGHDENKKQTKNGSTS